MFLWTWHCLLGDHWLVLNKRHKSICFISALMQLQMWLIAKKNTIEFNSWIRLSDKYCRDSPLIEWLKWLNELCHCHHFTSIKLCECAPNCIPIKTRSKQICKFIKMKSTTAYQLVGQMIFVSTWNTLPFPCHHRNTNEPAIRTEIQLQHMLFSSLRIIYKFTMLSLRCL